MYYTLLMLDRQLEVTQATAEGTEAIMLKPYRHFRKIDLHLPLWHKAKLPMHK